MGLNRLFTKLPLGVLSDEATRREIPRGGVVDAREFAK